MGARKVRRSHVLYSRQAHTILTSIFAWHVAGELSQAGSMRTKARVAIGCSRSTFEESEARRQLRHVLSSSLHGPRWARCDS
eukprot:4927623-Prymnesium_polylepis.1